MQQLIQHQKTSSRQLAKIERELLKNRSGQSLIETCVAIAIICLIFMGMLQISEIFAAREILNHAAARGVRARTVGFNWWMVEKAIRVASIPNAGKLTSPDFENDDIVLQQMVANLRPGELWEQALRASPSSLQYNLERARIPEYMASYNEPRADHILNYENWNGSNQCMVTESGSSDKMISMKVSQNYPLWVPLHRAFYRGDSIHLNAEFTMENHFEHYIDDMFW